MAFDLKLIIGGKSFPGTETKGTTTYNYNLHEVWFNRRVYQPGEIVAEVSINPSKTISELSQMLLLQGVTLKKGNTVIAKNYYVHEILPQTRNGDDGIFVKLVIFSMDKLMTLDKYSKVYAGLKLGSEILNKERLNFKLGETAVEVDFGELRMLKYMYSTMMDTDREQTGKKVVVKFASEFIHPYLVQYNESFYDFLSRTANRCGEFLYFEDGSLNLGLKTRMETVKGVEVEKVTVIKNQNSVTYKSISSSKLDIDRYARDTMKDKWGLMEETNYDVAKKNAAGYPHDAFPRNMVYNTELTSDEFFFPLYADKFTTFKREMGGVGTDGEKAATQIFPKLCDITANSSDMIDFTVKLVADEAKTLVEAELSNADKNKSGKEDYISIEQGTEKPRMLEKGDGETCAVPFGSLSKEGWTTLDYYRDVRKYEEQLQRDIICIDMDTTFVDVKLGDKIKLSDTGEPYIVIQILIASGTDPNQKTKKPHIYTDYDGNDSPKMEENPNLKVFAIPYLKTKEDEQEVYKPYPPVLNVPVVRKAEPQTAFVTASNDPKYQGRVRIVYPWQTDNCGDMVKLKKAEEEYEAAQKTYLEKKQKQEQLEKELDVLSREKQMLEDNTFDEEKALEEIIDRLQDLNITLGTPMTKTELEEKVTEDEINEAQKEIAPLEVEVNKKEAEVVKRQAKLKSLESEKAPLDKELEELERRKEDLEKENALLQLKYEKETDETKKAKLYDKIDANKKKITSLKTQISGADGTGGLKATIKTKQDIIKDLKDEKSNIKSILYAESLLENEKEKLEAQREKYILLQQKKGIEDYFAELNGSMKKKIINDQIAVEKDGKLTGGKAKEVKDARDATEKAMEELEKKEKAVDNLAKELQKVVSAMSSPWIRMTSPMATDGGGTIFKPRLGDEVLVNYECGNVERPYVVGSLFSKNVLEPDERINREVGPNLHKGASIAIVSPNGHGITFKDPKSDAGFAASVYPGIGLINKYIIDNIQDAKWPKSKDLAGGIKIGDRYGLYSIDMSSDKRSVKISSSLGTVSLNAFTGITISAPNGDIKIEGKNVSIKAGNNLTLTSGTNIETTSKRKKKHNSTGELVGTLMGMGVTRVLKEFVTPFIDISLARTAFEVVLGPIEGTTLIKSHRYMKLEAGPGKAMIQQDRYTNKVSVSSKLSALVPSLNNYNCDKLAEGRDLYSYIVYIIRTFNENISKFCDTYKTNWRDAYDKKNAYDAHTVYLDNNATTNPDILTKCIDKDQWVDLELKDFTFDPAHQNQQEKQDLLDSANALGVAGVKLFKHLNDFITTMPKREANPLPVEQAVWQVGKDILGDIINSCDDDFESKYVTNGTFNNNFLSSDTPNDYASNSTKMKRRFSALLVIKVAADNNYKDILKIRYKESDLTDNIISSKDEWEKFVSAIKLEPDPGFVTSFVDNVKDPLLKLIDLDGWLHTFKEKDMWNDKKNGQILLSDSKDFTIDFEGGGLNKCEKANQANTDYLKELLNTI